jgi:transposase
MLGGMAGKSRRAKLVLTPEEVERLERLCRSQTAPRREVQRAEILWCYHAGETIAEIARKVSMTRTSVAKWVGKALNVGLAVGLKDAYHRPREPVITEAAKAWVVHLACSKPQEYGYAAELWTRQSLAQHVRRQAVAAGHPALARAAKATVQRILTQQALRPDKVTYYLERRQRWGCRGTAQRDHRFRR